MKYPTIYLSDDGHPTDEYLEFIRGYKGEIPILEFIGIICDNYNFGGWGYKLHKKYKGECKFELYTGGWPGSESIVQVIIHNIYLTHFLMQYYQWRTGGHYYFKIPIK